MSTAINNTFTELQTPARDEELETARGALRDALAVLGIGEDDLTTDTYTGAVLRARSRQRATFPPGRDYL